MSPSFFGFLKIFLVWVAARKQRMRMFLVEWDGVEVHHAFIFSINLRVCID